MTRSVRHRDDGATLVITALVLFSLIAVSAFVVDVGALVLERRVLQNGADAAALSVAKDCAGGACGSYAANAQTYADANSNDGTSTVAELCGTSPLPVCVDPPVVAAGAGYVRVETETRTTEGSNLVPFSFARIMGFTGATVTRTAIVAWGGPQSLTSSLPITISDCEFAHYTANGTSYAPAPPYPPYPAAPERVLYFHTTTSMPSGCPASGSGADLPGGFGWLKTSTDCWTPSSVDGWFDDKTGRPAPNSCDPPEMAALKGTVVYVPVYDATNGLNGSNGKYHIKGYAAFYLTGYSINGSHKEKSLVTGSFPCGGSNSCLSGFFVSGQLSSSPGTVGGPSMGVVVIQVIG